MRTVKISEETYERLKDQLTEAKEVCDIDGLIGGTFFFRTVTYHLIGRVTRRFGQWLVLADAAWVADSGRFTQCIKDGTLNEVEPVGPAYLNLDSVTDFFPWKHGPVGKQK